MSLGNPNTIIIVVLLGVAGIMFVIASLTGGKKWRTLYDEEREEYASYAEGADTELRAARERIAELEREYATLQQQHSDALVSIANLKSEASARDAAEPVAVEPVAAVPLKLVPSAPEEPAEPVVAAAAVPVAEAVAEPEPPVAVPEHRPIAPETTAEEAHARPIAPLGGPMTELPPAPIYAATPLRAVEPPEPEVAPPAPPPAEPVAEVAPPAHEPVASEPAHAEPEPHHEEAHSDASELPTHAKPFATLTHLAEGVAIAEAAHLAWNAYESHKHHAEAQHAAEAEHGVEHGAAPAAEPVQHAAPEHVVEAAPVPAEPPAAEAPAKAWFGSARRDDLTRMRGLDAATNTKLVGLGVTSYDDIVNLSHEDEMALEQRLDLPAGYITREQWRDQASLLRGGREDEFNQRFGHINA